MLRLRTLGTLELGSNDGRGAAEALVGQPRRLALLLYLAAAPGALVRRDLLVALFWPELDHHRARAALRQAVHVLRETLGPELLVARGAEALGVDAGRLWCDAPAFERLLDDGRPAEALELYRGCFLPGFHVAGAPEFDAWLEQRRARLRARAAGAAGALAERHARDADAAVCWARRAAQLDPHGEAALRRLLRALVRAGEHVAAADALAEFTRRATRELGVGPSPETRRVAAELLGDDRPRRAPTHHAPSHHAPPHPAATAAAGS